MSKTFIWFLLIIVPLFVIDQITKWWVVLHFSNRQLGYNQKNEQVSYWENADGESIIPVIDGFFNIIRVHNQGVAFGLGNGSSWAPIVFLIVPFIALIVVAVLWRKNVFIGLSKYSAPLLIAGVLGNLVDRLTQGFYLEHLREGTFLERLSAGYVVDFIDVTIPLIHYRWPSFNVADSCICIAASLLFLSGLKEAKEEKGKKL